MCVWVREETDTGDISIKKQQHRKSPHTSRNSGFIQPEQLQQLSWKGEVSGLNPDGSH